VLALLWRLPRAIPRDERVAQLARTLDVPLESVREQMASAPERRRAEQAAARRAEQASNAPAGARQADAAAPQAAAVAPLVERAWRGILGAVLQAPSLAAHAAPWLERCPHGALRELFTAVLAADAQRPGAFTLDDVFVQLADSRARDLVVPLAGDAERSEDLALELDEHLSALQRWEVEQRLADALQEAGPLPRGGAGGPRAGEGARGGEVPGLASYGEPQLHTDGDDTQLRLLAELDAQRELIKHQRRFAPASRTTPPR
jgi:hypothetical protein